MAEKKSTRSKKSTYVAPEEEKVVKDKATEPTEKVEEAPEPAELSVSDYFNYVKGMKEETDSEEVKRTADVCMSLLKKFEILGQKEAAKKAKNAFDVLKRDLELYEKGIKQYVHIDNVTKYLKEISGHSVKLIELENFPREIPDDVMDKWLAVRECFDGAYVVFTDYTEKTEEKNTAAAASGKTSTAAAVEKKRKEKDPILFGILKVDKSVSSLKNNTYEKMYFVADWVDDYCDLTFDKMIEAMAEKLKIDQSEVVKEIKPVTTKEEFKKEAGI